MAACIELACEERESGYFGSAEIMSMMTDLEPADTADWLRIFAARLRHRYPLAYDILTLEDDEWLSVSGDPSNLRADSMIACAIMACLSPGNTLRSRLVTGTDTIDRAAAASGTTSAARTRGIGGAVCTSRSR